MMIKEENIVFLKVSSFAGISVGAEHFYGKLNSLETNEDVELKYPLTKEDAAYLNKKLGIKSGESTYIGYQAGEEHERFPSGDKVIEWAKKRFKKHFPKATVLVLGTRDPNPQRVLVGPREFKSAINKLYRRHRKLDWDYEEDREEMEEIEAEWQKLWPRKYI